MLSQGSVEPVAAYQGCIRVEFSEKRVGDTRGPDAVSFRRPVPERFCACNHSRERLQGTIGDAGIRTSGVFWVYVFTVNARQDDDLIARLRQVSCLLDGGKRIFFRAVAGRTGGGVYIVDHSVTPLIVIFLSGNCDSLCFLGIV